MFNIIALQSGKPVELTIDTAIVTSTHNMCHVTLLYLDENLDIKERIVSKESNPNLIVTSGDLVVYSGDKIFVLNGNILEPLNPNIPPLRIDKSIYDAIVSSCCQLYARITNNDCLKKIYRFL